MIWEKFVRPVFLSLTLNVSSSDKALLLIMFQTIMTDSPNLFSFLKYSNQLLCLVGKSWTRMIYLRRFCESGMYVLHVCINIMWLRTYVWT